MSEAEKKRYIPARVSGDGTIYYSGGIVFSSIEEARKKSQQPPNEFRWAVLELHAIDPPEAGQLSRVILAYATVATHQSGCEIVYERSGSRRVGEMYKADTQDIVCCAALIDYAGKEEEKEDWFACFSCENGYWLLDTMAFYENQKLGLVGGKYCVKVQLPKIREVPSAN